MKIRGSLSVLATLLLSVVVFRAGGAETQDNPQRIEIVASRFSYAPATITLKKGQPVILVLKSTDVPHGLRFRELNVNLKASKGGTGSVQFTPDRTGDFVGHCSVFCGAGHGKMTLLLHVVE